ncbi:AfsR/SARP family transcriptional regulator [Nocardiopsis sp. NPDC050513]|uniref:AfsR/SARP family transcriptional regulator n=1 Tax=Nocardiopsis sp. NPDC050513 TaxID=3364338 RepID=UPI0037918042
MAVEISVLGAIETHINGHPVDLGHARRQSVFIGLLADANHLVSVDQLIYRVWGQHPPQGARSSLYSYVSRIRAALSAAGNDAVVDRRPGGYTLSLSDHSADAVDLHRFRAFTALARDASSEDAALALFEDGLGLWRADAFGALDSPWVNELRESLRLERFGAELDRNDLLLRQGRQGERLGDLLSLAQRHPLDERLIGQLMLTLYREGRTAQALDYFEFTRRALSDEMGTDPGAELRDLHLKILNADPDLNARFPAPVLAGVRSASAAASPSVPLPSQLPPPPPPLAGRDEELAALDTAQESEAVSITVVCGLGGVGKTALALRWAHDNLARFPDGQLYVNLHGFSSTGVAAQPQTVVHDFLTALGVDAKAIPTSTEAQVGLYRSLLAKKRMLILLDNARDAEQVRPLIPGSPTCTVVITSRHRLSGLLATDAAGSVTLGPLTSTEAHQLMAARLGERRVAEEPEAVESVIRSCGRYPLALTIASAHAASSPHLPLRELAAELRETETLLDVLDTGDLDTSLRGVLDASYRALPDAAARLLGLLSLAPGQSIGLPATAALAGLPPARARVLLRDLESVHLVHQPMPGRYELHDVVRLRGKERAERDQPEEDRRRALGSLVDFYVRTADAANRLLSPNDMPSSAMERERSSGAHALAPRLADEAQALEWFTAERSWLPAVVRLAAELGLYREAWRLCWDTYLYFRRCGHVDDFIGTARAGLDAATRLTDPDAPTLTALARRGLASAMLMAGHHGEEPLDHLSQALTHFASVGDLLNQAHTHQVHLLFSILADDEERALEHAERALEQYRRVGASVWEGSALNNMGWCLAQFGHHERAHACCQESLRLSRALGHRVGEAAVLDSLGYISTRSGRHAEAVEHYRQAIQVCRILGDAFEEANALHGLAEAHDALGEAGPAREAWRRALALYRAQHRTEQARDVEDRLRASP